VASPSPSACVAVLACRHKVFHVMTVYAATSLHGGTCWAECVEPLLFCSSCSLPLNISGHYVSWPGHCALTAVLGTQPVNLSSTPAAAVGPVGATRSFAALAAPLVSRCRGPLVEEVLSSAAS
jgi:hypothetical protein